MIALLGMFLVPTNILRSLAAGAVIVGVVSVAAALTLLPAMLHLLGDRVNSLRLPIVGKRLGSTDSGESRIWRTFIEGVLRHRVVMLTLTVGVLVALAVPLLGLHIGQSGVATLPNNLPSKEGYVAVQRYFPNQDPYPVEIVADGGDARTARGTCRSSKRSSPAIPGSGPAPFRCLANGKILALTVPIRGDVVSEPGRGRSAPSCAAISFRRSSPAPTPASMSGAKRPRQPTTSAPSRRPPPTCCCSCWASASSCCCSRSGRS